MKLPKLIATDIDGVWTDGGMFYTETGDELKKFNTSDSAGVLFARHLQIPVAIITGENTNIVKLRAAKLQISHVYQGISEKVSVCQDLTEQLGISMHEVAYIGDDLGDFQLLKKVGFSSAPVNAPAYIKRVVDFVTPVKGGEGAFRCFVEEIINRSIGFDSFISSYLDSDAV